MMKVSELSRNQLIELKQNILVERLDAAENRCPSYGESADVDELVSDNEVFVSYDRMEFTTDDFFYSIQKEEEC